jgi:hypothetical protein
MSEPSKEMIEPKGADYQSGAAVGEVRVSSHIDCRHWTPGLRLRAWRHGSEWDIWRSDSGELVRINELECVSWDEGPLRKTNRRVTWSGNNFNLNPGGGSSTLRYVGTDNQRTQYWECYWDPNRTDENGILGTFVHTQKHGG